MSARVWGVGELIGEVNAALAGGFGEVWVRGELSGVKVAASGHRYFQVKDADGTLSCAMWASRADRLRYKLTDGLAVVLRGTLEVYPQRGSLQLIVAEATPEGLGELQLAFEQLKSKLEAEGLFAPERKRALPALPQRLGVVTSASGAAVRDVLNVLSRWEHLQVLLYPVRVQGKGAEGEIARAVRYLGRSGAVDVVLVVRGGGSLEDLWAFNEEMVARAIAACQVPVVSGVGHEVDFTIADFVADVRAATPTQAAEIVVQKLEAQRRRLDDADEALALGERGRLERLRSRLDRAATIRHLFAMRLERERLRVRALGAQVAPARLRRLVAGVAQRVPTAQRLRAALRSLIGARRQALAAGFSRLKDLLARLEIPRYRRLVEVESAVARERLRSRLPRAGLMLEASVRTLEALSPRRVLERGYSITTREGDAMPLREAAAVAAGERLRTQFAKGVVRSLVIGREGDQGSLFGADDVEMPEGRDG